MTKNDLSFVFAIEQQQVFHQTVAHLEQALSPPYKAIVMEIDKTIVGFGILMIVTNEAEIHELAVDLQHRKKGFGKELLRYLLQLTQKMNIKKVYLEVRTSNVIAIKLYEQFDFKQTGIRKNYYRTFNGFEDAVLMTKKFLTGSKGKE